MTLIPYFWDLVLLDCYRNKMDAKDKEFYDIVFKNCTEEEIYAILLKKKEIDDITPKLRTKDDNKMLRSLFNKMRKFPKDLIAEIKNKFPSLQRKPKTAEQRKEQDKEYQSQKRSAESEIDKEKRLKKQKEYDTGKRSAESEIERQTRLTKDKEYHSQKRSGESEIERQTRLTKKKEYQSKIRSGESEKDKEMRLNKQKEYNEKRIAESQIVCNLCNSSNHLCRKCKNTVCNFCGEQDPSSDNEMHIMHKKNDTRCKVGESQIGRQRRLNKQKEYDNAKRSAESQEDKEKRLNKQKEYDNAKRSAESVLDKQMRQTKDKATHKKTYRQPTKD